MIDFYTANTSNGHRVAIMLETFIEEFSNILQRNLGAASGGPAR